MSTPDYVLQQDFQWNEGTETRQLSAGTFVRPVKDCYVPKHVKEDTRWKVLREDKYIFCYCSKGFIRVPRTYVRKA